MSKAKDNYYELKGYLDSYMGGPVNDVSNYVTELENKAEMFDEMVNTLSHLQEVSTRDGWVDTILRPILDRAKKMKEEGE